MAKSGQLVWTQEYLGYDFIFDWQVVSQDVQTNTSTISFSLSLKSSSSYGTENISSKSYLYDPELRITTSGGNLILRYSASGSGTSSSKGWPSLNGYQQAGAVTFEIAPYGSINNWFSGTFELEHSGTGDETFGVQLRIDSFINVPLAKEYKSTSYSTYPAGYVTSGGTGISIPSTRYWDVVDYIEVWATLDEAPTEFTDEALPTIKYTNNAGELATVLQAGISVTNNHTSPEVAYKNLVKTGNSYTFTLTETDKQTLYKAVLDKNRTTAAAKIYVKSTVYGETKYSYKDATLKFVNYQPTLDVQLKDVNPISKRVTGNDQIFVRGVSNVEYDLGIDVKKDATLASFYIQNGDDIDNVHESGTFYGISDNVFYIHAMDNRNHSVSEVIEKNAVEGKYIEYFPLTCVLKNTFLDGNGTLPVIVTGKYFDGFFGFMNNSLTFEYKCYRDGTDPETVSWTSKGKIQPDMDLNDNYTYSFDIEGLDYTGRYVLEVRAVDELMTQPATAYTVVAAQPLFDWGPNDFAFYVPVTINGDTVPTIVAQGTAGIWTYRTWSDGTAECWGKKDFTVNVTSQWGSMYTTGAISGSNISFPYGLFAETPIVNASLLVRSAGGILMAPGGAGSNIANMDQTGVYEIARGTSLSNAQYTINYQVIGKWK
jgi:hypothetical protein